MYSGKDQNFNKTNGFELFTQVGTVASETV